MDALKLPVESKKADKDVSIGDAVIKSICNDLERLNWKIKLPTKKDQYPTLMPPSEYSKETIRAAMSYKRAEIIEANKKWIDKHIKLARKNLAHGFEALSSAIEPIIEECITEKQHDLFRIYRYYWSSPHSEYVGRRIKLIVRDNALPNKPVIGIAALGSPIIHIPERDEWIGWDKDIRTKNLIYTMDAYVIGALPPYNYLLGGKLISYILASKEVREIYQRKYEDQITIKEKRKANQLAGIFTTSLYGNSSQYNRLNFDGKPLYTPIGYTKGFGTLHLSDSTIKLMIDYLKGEGIIISHKFGDGPSWVMRVIRAAGDKLGFDSDFLLKHSFKRGIYFLSHASNFKEFLNDEDPALTYNDLPMVTMVDYWKSRWLKNRILNEEVRAKALSFHPDHYAI